MIHAHLSNFWRPYQQASLKDQMRTPYFGDKTELANIGICKCHGTVAYSKMCNDTVYLKLHCLFHAIIMYFACL